MKSSMKPNIPSVFDTFSSKNVRDIGDLKLMLGVRPAILTATGRGRVGYIMFTKTITSHCRKF